MDWADRGRKERPIMLSGSLPTKGADGSQVRAGERMAAAAAMHH